VKPRDFKKGSEPSEQFARLRQLALVCPLRHPLSRVFERGRDAEDESLLE